MKSFVLIVDDEPIVRKVLTEMLSDIGLPVLEAIDASEALNTLRIAGDTIAVMVTDVRMPGFLNGLDLAKFAKHCWPSLQVIVMSGFAESVREELPHNAWFLPKPWEPEQMVSTIVRAAAEFDSVQAIRRVH